MQPLKKRYNAAVQVQEDLIQANKTEEQIEMESYQTRLELLREFNLDEQALTAEHNAKIKDLNMLALATSGGACYKFRACLQSRWLAIIKRQ